MHLLYKVHVVVYLVRADDDHVLAAHPDGEDVSILLAPLLQLLQDVGQCRCHRHHVAQLRERQHRQILDRERERERQRDRQTDR